MRLRALFALLLVVPLVCFAGEKKAMASATDNQIDQALMCEMTPKEFFADIVSRQLIVTKPVSVNNSVSVFRPHLFRKITAQQMHVALIAGYVADQIMFATGSERPRHEVYALVVDEGIANVQAVLTSIGSPAKTRLMPRNQTEIICQGI